MADTETPPPNRKASWITEGIIIAATPLVAYVLTFEYEVGFASVFQIPKSFIKFDLSNILIVMLVLWAILAFFIPIANIIYGFIWPKRGNPVYRSLLRIFLILPIVVIPIYLHGRRWKEWIAFVIIALIMVFIEFLLPLAFQRGQVNYNQKLEAQEVVEYQTASLFAQIGNTGIIAIAIFFSVFIISYSAGRAAAFEEIEFLIANTTPECVVLRIYGSNIVCSSFDRNTKKVSREFRIFQIGTDPGLILRQERIGPLYSDSLSTSVLQSTPQFHWVTVTPSVSPTVTVP